MLNHNFFASLAIALSLFFTKLVLQQNSIDYSETKIAVAGLVPGIYYLNIYFNDSIKTTKVFSKK